jgi:uncharacterized membrane protein YebE (DUF533 family)
MLRISALEKAVPDDIRRTVRDHPVIALAAGALAGYYLGKSFGKEILTALVGVGISAGATNARRMFGVPPRDSRRP